MDNLVKSVVIKVSKHISDPLKAYKIVIEQLELLELDLTLYGECMIDDNGMRVDPVTALHEQLDK